MKKFTLASLFAAAFLLSGCSFQEINRNMDNSKNLRVGMTKDQVLQIMGPPLTQEVYNQPDEWYYFVRINWADGLYTKDECMPLVFQNGSLIGWGNEFLSRRNKVKP